MRDALDPAAALALVAEREPRAEEAGVADARVGDEDPSLPANPTLADAVVRRDRAVLDGDPAAAPRASRHAAAVVDEQAEALEAETRRRGGRVVAVAARERRELFAFEADGAGGGHRGFGGSGARTSWRIGRLRHATGPVARGRRSDVAARGSSRAVERAVATERQGSRNERETHSALGWNAWRAAEPCSLQQRTHSGLSVDERDD
mmetsp:Transcript_22258/g.69740  ORF Transcript_22258/g.69740 Transcript_22258/m.69740 type:complete len:206 (+) Transcript_22258:563-1180(+)